MVETEVIEWGGPNAIWRDVPHGAAWDPATIGLPGLERLRARVRGQLPAPPIDCLTGLVPVEAGVGTMTFAMPASEWFMTGSRFFLGGSLALLADAALICAIMSGLPQGVALTTQELSMHFLRVASPDSRRLTRAATSSTVAGPSASPRCTSTTPTAVSWPTEARAA